jgi:hypothetical protein
LFVAKPLDGSPTADEVHDDRDHSKYDQKVDEETAHVQHKKTTKPKHNQHNRKNEKHHRPSFLVRIAASGARRYTA